MDLALVQLTQWFEDGHFMSVKNTDVKKLPKLNQEAYGYVVEDESDASSDTLSNHSAGHTSSKFSRAFTGNLSGKVKKWPIEIAKDNSEIKISEDPKGASDVKEDNKEAYTIEKEYTQKQVWRLFMSRISRIDSCLLESFLSAITEFDTVRKLKKSLKKKN